MAKAIIYESDIVPGHDLSEEIKFFSEEQLNDMLVLKSRDSRLEIERRRVRSQIIHMVSRAILAHYPITQKQASRWIEIIERGR